MARAHVAACLAIVTIVLLLTLQLFTTWDVRSLLHTASSNAIPVSNDISNEVEGSRFLLGVGKADITGPVVEINLMGYADPDQIGTGLRQRLYCRAFIVGSIDEPNDRFVYLVLDTQSGDTAIRYGILKALEAIGNEYLLYNQDNVAVIGTHSHSGPGAWLNYLLPQITSKGFDKQSYQAIVDGSILAIQRAHESLSEGTLDFGSIDVEDANINRSPYAYLANPEEERARYEHDVDKAMTMLRFRRASDSKAIGVLTWFPVHGTSMLGNNSMISGDNKGVAAWLLETNRKGTSGFAEDFVAGFSQSNVGDTSPNVLGAWCEDGSGERCNFEDSTCGGRTQPCHGRGPYFREKDQGAKSCFEIGRRQYTSANQLLDTPASFVPLTGSTVTSLHTFKDLSNFTFVDSTLDSASASVLSTCSAALGYAFAAGTTDGPGAFDFTQNCTDCPADKNPLWKVARAFIHQPSREQQECHGPKPILLDVGPTREPYPWSPDIVDIQVLRVGQLIIIVSPGEATTMSGRRWKEAVANVVPSVLSIDKPFVVLGGPANSYTHYIATREEYGVQRYEGASTLYGPNTLAAYINLTLDYLPYLQASISSLPPLPFGPKPPININESFSFITPVIVDRPGLFRSFGDSLSDPRAPSTDYRYAPGEKVVTRFVGANPRNNLRLENTYAAVEKRLDDDGSWTTVRDDAHWSLLFRWERISTILGTSEVEVEWQLEDDVESGRYRMRYFGDSKGADGLVSAFEGVGGEFLVEGSSSTSSKLPGELA